MASFTFFKNGLNPLHAALLCLTASLIFGFSYIDMNIMSSASEWLIKNEILHPAQFGILVLLYFLGNCLLYIPAGYIVSRYSMQKIVIFNMWILSIGNLLLLSQDIQLFGTGRLLLGIAGAFSYLLVLRIAYYFVHPHFLGVAFGLISTVGLLGGFLSQGPLVTFINRYGWEACILSITFLIVILGITNFLLLTVDNKKEAEKLLTNFKSVIQDMSILLKKCFLWIYAAYALFMCSPIFLLTTSWGQEYLRIINISSEDAGMINGTIFIGIMVGAPIWGFSATTVHFKKCMLLSSILTFLITLIILHNVADMSVNTIYCIYFMLGLFMSAQIIVYTRLAQENKENHSLALSLLITFVAGGGVIIQFIFTYLLTIWPFSLALWLLPVCILIAVFIAIFNKMRGLKC